MNTENDDNKQNKISSHIRAIGPLTAPKNRKIVTKSDLYESKKDKISDVTDKDIKEKELETLNFSIKVHIPSLSILLNLSTVNSTKQKLTLSPVFSMLDLAEHDL